MTGIETEREDESPPDPALLRRLRIEFCIIFLAIPMAHAAFINTLGTLTPLIRQAFERHILNSDSEIFCI